MENINNFIPNSEEESKLIENYNNVSKLISKTIRGLEENQRLGFLRDAKPSDLSLMNLYLQALKNEDYETCEVAKALFLERGINIPENK